MEDRAGEMNYGVRGSPCSGSDDGKRGDVHRWSGDGIAAGGLQGDAGDRKRCCRVTYPVYSMLLTHK